MPESSSFHVVSGETPSQRGRDRSRAVVLIGFQRQGNLGLGYLASTLRSYGYPVEVFDFEADKERILEVVQAKDPILWLGSH
jgi:hypothetical protein